MAGADYWSRPAPKHRESAPVANSTPSVKNLDAQAACLRRVEVGRGGGHLPTRAAAAALAPDELALAVLA